jgi:hypothetical protein
VAILSDGYSKLIVLNAKTGDEIAVITNDDAEDIALADGIALLLQPVWEKVTP